MKYIVRLLLVECATTRPATEIKEATKEEVSSVYTLCEKIFGGNCVPRVGEAFPIYGRLDGSESVYIIQPTPTVSKVSHEPRQNTQNDSIRTPVITLKYNDGALGMVKDLETWSTMAIERINQRRECISTSLIRNGFTVIRNPSSASPLTDWNSERIGGVREEEE